MALQNTKVPASIGLDNTYRTIIRHAIRACGRYRIHALSSRYQMGGGRCGLTRIVYHNALAWTVRTVVRHSRGNMYPAPRKLMACAITALTWCTVMLGRLDQTGGILLANRAHLLWKPAMEAFMLTDTLILRLLRYMNLD